MPESDPPRAPGVQATPDDATPSRRGREAPLLYGALGPALTVHLIVFALAHHRLQPWLLDRTVDVTQNS